MICLQEKVLIISMLHSYRQAKGDINENGTNTGVKYECLKVKRKMFGFICSFSWGGRNSLLPHRRRPFVHVEQRPSDTCIQIYISQLQYFQMPVSPLYFQQQKKEKKEGCWHTACLRGVIHHYNKKESHNEYIQKDLFSCVHYFNFNFSCSHPGAISVHPKLAVIQCFSRNQEHTLEIVSHCQETFFPHRLKIKRNCLLTLLIKQFRLILLG